MDDATHRYEGIHCTMEVAEVAPHVLLLRIEGRDVGEFGVRPMQDLEQLLHGEGQRQLFIDARDTTGASVEVSNAWAQWLIRNRLRFSSVHLLAGSQHVRITAEFVRRFADLSGLMQVHTAAGPFDAALASSAA